MKGAPIRMVKIKKSDYSMLWKIFIKQLLLPGAILGAAAENTQNPCFPAAYIFIKRDRQYKREINNKIINNKIIKVLKSHIYVVLVTFMEVHQISIQAQ